MRVLAMMEVVAVISMAMVRVLAAVVVVLRTLEMVSRLMRAV